MKTKDGRELVALNRDVLDALTQVANDSAIELEDGTWVGLTGYRGVIAGGLGSYWITRDGRTADLNSMQKERLAAGIEA